jgi:hypothetical protein
MKNNETGLDSAGLQPEPLIQQSDPFHVDYGYKTAVFGFAVATILISIMFLTSGQV